MAKYHDVTVLCGDVSGELQTKKDLAKYFSENSAIEKLTINYVEPSRLIQWMERIHQIPGLWCFYYFAYNLWQRKAFKIAKELNAQTPYDLVHQLNMIGYREPGYLWKLSIPFVWGPVGGASNESWAFRSLFSWSGSIKVLLRNALNEIQKRIAWRSKKAARSARKIWVVTVDDMLMFRELWGVNATQMNEAGTDCIKGIASKKYKSGRKLRIAWSGIHTARKALPIVLHAIADPKIRDRVELDVLGDGSETKTWKKMADGLGIAPCVTWHGTLMREQALTIMNNAHVMTISSIKEATSIVLLEALSLGLPVICHDTCGMGIAVTNECGVKTPLKDPETSIRGFNAAICGLLEHPERVEALSRGALRRAEELSWDKKVKAISGTYSELLLA
jgi:glycosyltransferase involved in cell wall biosynthesis